MMGGGGIGSKRQSLRNMGAAGSHDDKMGEEIEMAYQTVVSYARRGHKGMMSKSNINFTQNAISPYKRRL